LLSFIVFKNSQISKKEEMIHNLSAQHSLVSNWVSELRDTEIQQDRQRFRRNLEKIAEVAGYEISKQLPFTEKKVTTPLGTSNCKVLSEQPVLATILRAGLTMHQGLLNYFDKADNSFLSAYRKHHPDGSFEISLQYISCPDLNNRIVVISDPMLATGASLIKAIHFLKEEGNIREIHIVCAIACTLGIEHVLKAEPNCTIWCGDIDEELTAKGYIVPGLGDAGDLAYGNKVQN